MVEKFYTGIGSRELPKHVLIFMRDVGIRMAKRGYVLRSGGAKGADTAFEIGAIRGKGGIEIFIPWNGFNDRFEKDGTYFVPTREMFETAKAALINQNIIKWFEDMKQGVQKLHARNYYQIHGFDMEENSMVCLYACPEDDKGKPTGGTRTAVMLAQNAGIPTYNLIHEDVRKEVANKIKLKWEKKYEEPKN